MYAMAKMDFWYIKDLLGGDRSRRLMPRFNFLILYFIMKETVFF
jgi:hypothetical protein